MNKKLIKMVLPALVFLFILSFSLVSAQTTNTTVSSDYQKAKEEWQARLQEMKTKREQITETRRAENLEKAKTMAEKAIDKVVARLSGIIKRIKKVTVITEERKTKLILDLQAQITALEPLKTKVSEATTKEELKTAVRDVKNQFVEIRTLVKKIVAEILASHIDKVLVKLNTITSKLETEIASLKAKDQNVVELEKTLKEAKNLLSQAKTKNTASEYKEARRLAEQARAKLAKLAGQIKDAQAKLKGGQSETSQ